MPKWKNGKYPEPVVVSRKIDLEEIIAKINIRNLLLEELAQKALGEDTDLDAWLHKETERIWRERQ